MKRAEKRQKFHNAVLRMLYPPPGSPLQEEDKPQPVTTTSCHDQNLDDFPNPDELNDPSSSTDGYEDEEQADDDAPKKLTRAQRKRLRKKKLKQAASNRRKMIGPLLPTSSSICDGGAGRDSIENEPQPVRENAAEGNDSLVSKPGISKDSLESDETSSGPKQNKLKQRRIAKKMAATGSFKLSRENG